MATATQQRPSDVLWNRRTLVGRIDELTTQLDAARAELAETDATLTGIVRRWGAVEGYGEVYALDDNERLTVVPVRSRWDVDKLAAGEPAEPETVRIAGRDEALPVAEAVTA